MATAADGQSGARAGSRLLQNILDLACQDPAISEAYLHVHVINEEALAFYIRWGFQSAGTVENYYRRIEPRHAVILSKRLAMQPAPFAGM